MSGIPFTDDFEVAAFSPDATILAISGETNSVLLYDVGNGRALRRLGEKGEYRVSFVSALSFSADGRRLPMHGDESGGGFAVWSLPAGPDDAPIWR